MKTHKVFSLIACILEHEIKDAQSNLKSVVATHSSHSVLAEDVQELERLKKEFEGYKSEFLERVLPY